MIIFQRNEPDIAKGKLAKGIKKAEFFKKDRIIREKGLQIRGCMM